MDNYLPFVIDGVCRNHSQQICNLGNACDSCIYNENNVRKDLQNQDTIAQDNIVIAINRRNIETLEFDRDRVQKLAPKIREEMSGKIIIAMSGYETYEDVERDAPLVDGFLIGRGIDEGKLDLSELKKRFPDKSFMPQIGRGLWQYENEKEKV